VKGKYNEKRKGKGRKKKGRTRQKDRGINNREKATRMIRKD